LNRVFARKAPSKAEIVVSVIGPMIGGRALDQTLDFISRHFALRDLGGGEPIADAADRRRLLSAAMAMHQPVTPYALFDLFRDLDLVVSDASGLALFDAALADALNTASAVHAGMESQVDLADFDGGTIPSDRLRFSAAAIAANAAAIHDRWND